MYDYYSFTRHIKSFSCMRKSKYRNVIEAQKRLALYIVNRFEDIQVIELKSFESSQMTSSWNFYGILNSKYTINATYYNPNQLDDKYTNKDLLKEISWGFKGGDIPKEKSDASNNLNINDINIKYWDGSYGE